jgi:uncharacterized RDD family membrane protein YckC
MRCRYCGSENASGEARCQKCQRRLFDVQARANPESTYAVVESAVAPALLPQIQPRAKATPTILQGGRSEPPRLVPTQPSLFAHRVETKVVGIEEIAAPPQPVALPSGESRARSAPRRKPILGQAAFEFSPAPSSKPFTREIDRSELSLPVAPLTLRALAAIFDAGIVLVLSAIPLGVARFLLGDLPLRAPYIGFYVLTPLAVALVFKLFYCLGGSSSPGLRGTRLRLVSFDGHRPSDAQRVMRLVSGWLSLAAGGMGLLWAIGDQDTLTMHDHISQTFLTAVRDERD